jgi:hypothetical protein
MLKQEICKMIVENARLYTILEVTIASEVLPCIHIVACEQALFCSQAIHIVGGGVLFPNNENKPK